MKAHLWELAIYGPHLVLRFIVMAGLGMLLYVLMVSVSIAAQYQFLSLKPRNWVFHYNSVEFDQPLRAGSSFFMVSNAAVYERGNMRWTDKLRCKAPRWQRFRLIHSRPDHIDGFGPKPMGKSRWLYNLPANVRIEAGWRSVDIELDTFDDVDAAEIDVSGPYAAINYHF